MDERAPLRVGGVVKARGLKGEVVVRLDNEASDVLSVGLTLFVTPKEAGPKAPTRKLTIRSVRPLTKGWGVMFEGVSGREAADALHGAALAVPWDALPALEDDEFYYEQIRGYSVVLADGREIGTVAGVFETNVDILVIRDAEGREHMLPMVDEFVTNIDHGARRIEVTPPDGLLELA